MSTTPETDLAAAPAALGQGQVQVDADLDGAPVLPLHLVGTQAFLPSLLAHIRGSTTTTGTALPLDQVILQSILLCLIAGEKHLILRTLEEDIGFTSKLVVWTLSHIFDLPTRKLRLRPPPSALAPPFPSRPPSVPPTPGAGAASSSSNSVAVPAPRRANLKTKCASNDPALFQRALFLHGHGGAETSADEDGDEDGDEGYPHHGHPHGHRRRYSGTAKGNGKGKGKKKPGEKRHAYTAPAAPLGGDARSRSVPSNLVGVGGGGMQRTTSPESMLLGAGGGGSYRRQQQQQQTTTTTTTTTREYAASAISTTPTTTTTTPIPIIRPQPIYAAQRQSLLPHAYTDPLPASPTTTARPRSSHSRFGLGSHRRHSRVSSTSTSRAGGGGGGGPPQLPRALVLSGLEDASEGVQRALTRVLADGKVVLEEEDGAEDGDGDGGGGGGGSGVWTLPEGFFVVYVCPWSTTERPGVHKSLLDKFAMSTNVFVPQNIRRDFHLLPFSPVPTHFLGVQHQHQQFQSNSNNNNTSLPSPQYKFFSHSNPGTPSPAQALALPQTYTPPPATPAALPGSSSVHRRASTHSNQSHAKSSLYTYHSQHTHHTQVPTNRHSTYSTLSTLYAATTHPTASAPAPPTLFRTPPIPSSWISTLRSMAQKHTYISPDLRLYMADIFSAARNHARLDAMLLGRSALKDAEALVRASRVLGVDLTGMELLRPVVGGVGAGAGAGVGDEAYEGFAPGAASGKAGEDDDTDEDEDDEDEYSSALDISIHSEPLLTTRAQSVTESALPAPLAAMRTLDVSEVNIARIVPRVISHRVRLRSGPEEEVLASALFGATFAPPLPPPPKETRGEKEGGMGKNAKAGDGQGEDGKKNELVSVKAVLVQILAEV
ncbi:hypothetical protein BDN70DRAFT_879192 [Pholiota conissans]|uniref:Uncharacterized protein n=1 Tax=Pholiota conissans TaxID=109636 RepID=A0A9P5Z1L9_9AGAR|nr:hypothetical protein BDN70DRAFT_879192 [Pholiota conissans]